MKNKKDKQKKPFTLDTRQTLRLLRAVPGKTRCFQVDEENSFSYEYIGTAKEVCALLDLGEQWGSKLQWNCGDETVYPVELAFVDASDIVDVYDDDYVYTGEHCLLMRYRRTGDQLDFPKLSEVMPRMPIPLACITVGKGC